MKKYVPYDKLSKKQKKAANAAQRKNWGVVDPVTRMSEFPRAYNRSKMKRAWKKDFTPGFYKNGDFHDSRCIFRY